MIADFILTILSYGTIKSIKKYRIIKFTYMFLIIIVLIAYFIIPILSITNLILIIFFIILAVGTWEYIKDIPRCKRIKKWRKLFENMNLSDNNHIPCFMYNETISQYASIVAFKTLIPLNVWQEKKDFIAMHINKKILTILQNEDNNQIIKLVIEDEPLPSEIEWNDDYKDYRNDVLNIGFGYFGLVSIDLKQYPHAFIAGETGSGKSNILKCLIHQALNKDYDIILIDFKRGVSFSKFSNYVDIYYDYKLALNALSSMVAETNKRLDLFRNYKVDNIDDYNNITGEPLNRKIIFIDELAELLKPRDKEISNLIYDSIETLTRLSRAVGIHLIMGIHRPDSTIISGQIKNNVSFRICGRFVDREPSQIMLCNDLASNLINIKGRFIVKNDELSEIQCFYYSDSSTYDLKPKIRRNIPNPIMEAPKEEKAILPVVERVTAPPKSTHLSSDLNFDFSDITK